MNLTLRSTETEWMDEQDVPAHVLTDTFKDLNRVNAWLGGNQITINTVFQIIKNYPKESYTILDAGCGDGNMLRELAMAFRKAKVKAKLIGLELRADIVELAHEASRDFPEIEYLQGDIFQIKALQPSFDIILCTLTLHHFKNEAIETIMAQFQEKASIGVVVNDLHRSRLAYYLFKVFSAIFLKTKMARNDGLVSIKRGFKKKELMRFASKLPQAIHYIQWKWAFRYVWTASNQRQNNYAVPR